MNSTMACRGFEVPDLKFRMSKKIAQLTKVIYQLNNKNEDYEFEMLEMEEQHESEVQQILEDAAAKMNIFKNQLEDRRDEQKLLEATKKLEQHYQCERQAALDDLQLLKEKSKERETNLQSEASRQIQELKDNLEQLRRELRGRAAEIDRINTSFVKKERDLSAELERSRLEVEKAIQEGNKRYNIMLSQRMDCEDALSKSLKQQMDARQMEVQELQQKLDVERDAWCNEKFQLNKCLEASEKSWQEQTTRMMEEISKLRRDLENQVKRRESSENDLMESNVRVQDLVAENGSRQAKIVNLEETLSFSQSELKRKCEELSNLELKNATFQESLRDGTSQIEDLEQRLKNMQTKVECLEASWSRDKYHWGMQLRESENKHDCLSRQLSESRTECEEHVRQIDTLNSRIESLQAEVESTNDAWKRDLDSGSRNLEESKEQAKKAISDMNRGVRLAQEEIISLRQELEESRRLGKLETSKQIQAITITMGEKLKEQKRLQLLREEQLATEHAQTVDMMRRDTESTIGSIEMKLNEENQRMLSLREADHAEQRRLLLQAHDSDKSKWAEELREKTVAAEEYKFKMEQCLRNLEFQVDRKESLIRELSKSESDARNAVVQLQKDKGDLTSRLEENAKGAAEMNESLSEKIGQLEILHKQEIKNREDREYELKGKIQMLDKENREQKIASELRLQNMEKSLKQDHRNLVESLAEKESQRIQDLKCLRESMSDAAERDMKSLRESMEEEKANDKEKEAARWAEEKFEQSKQFRKQKELLLKEHEKELVNLKQGFAFEKQTILESTREKMETALHKSSQEHQREIDSVRSDLTDVQRELRQQEAAKQKIEENAANKERSMSMKFSHDLELQKSQSDEKLRRLQKSTAEALDRRNEEWQRERGSLQKTISRLENEGKEMKLRYEDIAKEKEKLDEILHGTKEALAQKSREMSEKIFEMKQDRDDEVSHLASMHASERASLLQQHDDEIRSLENKHREILGMEDRRFNELADRHANLRKRFDGRESRKEDLERIRMLESNLGAAEGQLAGAKEKLQELHREMLLREDSYNKHFKNGGVAQRVLDVDSALQASQGVVDWMMSSRKRPLGGSK